MIKWYWIAFSVLVTALAVSMIYKKREQSIVNDINEELQRQQNELTKLSNSDNTTYRELAHGLIQKCKTCYIPPSKIVGVNGEWGERQINGSCKSCSA